MKKLLKTAVVSVLALCCMIMLFACKNQKLKFGKEFVEADSQVKILTELKSNTADIGVMDSVMAHYYMTTEGAGELQIIENCVLADENYGIAGRKGSGIINAINKALVELSKDGTVKNIAEKYQLQNDISIQEKNYEVDTEDKDYQYIVNERKKIIVGYTLFAPIAYENSEGELVGFDTELAKKVGEKLGVKVEFQLISWETKEIELNAKNIDLLWNGLTITEERSASMEMSAPYMKNKQVAVIRKADKDKYTNDKTTWKKAVMIAESGSAGEGCIVEKTK